MIRGDLQKKLSGVNFSVNNLLLFSNFLHRQRQSLLKFKNTTLTAGYNSSNLVNGV